MSILVLAGDIGGTKTLLALAEVGAGRVALRQEARFENRDHGDFDGLLAAFLARCGGARPAAACFAVAGPVAENRAALTNLSWSLDGAALTATLGCPVRLINDFEAVGHGIAVLAPTDLATLQPGAPEPRGVRAVLGAGTGLGEGWMVWDGDAYRVQPTEGGHCDFAPRDELQMGFLRHLQARHGHVSYERILSGAGLAALYDYLRESGAAPESPELAAARAAGEDPAALVTRFALERGDALATATLEGFVDIYGAEAGNLALKTLPRGGLYVAGGIAPRILPRLRAGGFMAAFLDKGRFAGLLATLPVHVVVNPGVGLLGAAAEAARHA